MEVSKLTLSEEMERAIHNPQISNKKKRELRTARVKEYINSKPSGTEISKRELARIAGYPSTSKASGYIFIDSLIKKGKIHCHRISRNKMSWSTDDNLVIVKPPTVKVQGGSETPMQPEHSNDLQEQKTESLEELAVTFAWTHNTDSLREFIKWMKQENKI